MFKHITSIILTLSVIFSSTLLFAQDNQKIEELERQLNRLEEKIQEAQHFASLFQNPILNQIVQSAEDYYRQARLAFQQRQYILIKLLTIFLSTYKSQIDDDNFSVS